MCPKIGYARAGGVFDLNYLNLLVNVVAYVNTLSVFPVFSAKFLLSQSITSK